MKALTYCDFFPCVFVIASGSPEMGRIKVASIIIIILILIIIVIIINVNVVMVCWT